MKERANWKYILTMSGAICSTLMGAAFATGQEMLQFFSSFGIYGFVGLIIAGGMIAVTGYWVETLICKRKEEMASPSDLFKFYYGDKLSRIMSLLVTLLIGLDCIMMMTGAGAALDQFKEGTGVWGRLILVCAVCVTVIFGLSRLVEIVGMVGYLMVFFMGAISIIAIVRSPLGISEGGDLVSELEFTRGASSWWLSAIKYGGAVILALIPVWILCGRKAAVRTEAAIAPFLSSIIWCSIAGVMVWAHLGSIEMLSGAQIPNLKIAAEYISPLASVFLIMLLMAAFSAITTMFWYVVEQFVPQGGGKFRITALILGIVLFFASGLISFDLIVNYVFTILFVVGMVLFVTILLSAIKGRREKR